MDLVLNIADDLVLDNLWAKIVPLKAFAVVPFNNGTLSRWDQLISALPHPPLPLADIAEAVPAISAWPRSYIPRQLASLMVITMIGINLLYFVFAWLSYTFVFNHEMMKHPRFLKNQVKLEIQTSVGSFPGMMIMTLPIFQAEVMGYSRLYDRVDTYGWFYFFASIPL